MKRLLRELLDGARESVSSVGRYALFTGRLLLEAPRGLLRFGLVVEQVYNAGALSLVIIMLSGLFVGMVLGLQGFDLLERFGSEESLGTAEAPRPEISIEAEVPLAELTRNLASEIDSLRPFGEGNPEPLLASLGVTLAGVPRTMGSGRTLSFRIRANGGSVRAVGFGWAPNILEIESLGKSGRLDLAYRLSRDIRSGEPELLLEEYRPSS